MSDDKKIVLVAFETDADRVELLHELLQEFTKNLPGLKAAPQGVADCDDIEGVKFVLLPRGFSAEIVPDSDKERSDDPMYG